MRTAPTVDPCESHPYEVQTRTSEGEALGRAQNLHAAPMEGRFDALVTHGWGRIAYNIVRSLGRRGLKVALGTDEYSGMAVLSRYTAESFRHPCFIRDTPGFIACLREFLQKYGPRVYIPSEQEVLIVAKHRDQLGETDTIIPIAPFSTLRQLHRKDSALRLAASLGIPTPETIVPENPEEVSHFAEEYGDPVVFKRLSSSGGRGLAYVTRAGLLSSNGHSPLHEFPFGQFLVQRQVQGTGYGVSMLFHHGELRAKFTHKRLRERSVSGGVSTLRMSVCNPLLEEYAERLLRRVRFHGVAMVEFKYDEAQKKAWLLEVNPRFWGSLALAIRAGVDFPYLLYQMAVAGDVEPVLDYQKNVQLRWILGDAAAILNEFGRNGSHNTRPAEAVSAKGFDDFEWRDPLPLFGEFLFSARKYLKTLRLGQQHADLDLDQL